MGIIKNSFVFIGIGLFSVSCFAAKRFYCPEPSNVHIKVFERDEVRKKYQYEFTGTDANGLVFKTGGIGTYQPPFDVKAFTGGVLTLSPDKKEGFMICYYRGYKNEQSDCWLQHIYRSSTPIKAVGKGWQVSDNGQRYDCGSGQGRGGVSMAVNVCAIEMNMSK